MPRRDELLKYKPGSHTGRGTCESLFDCAMDLKPTGQTHKQANQTDWQGFRRGTYTRAKTFAGHIFCHKHRHECWVRDCPNDIILNAGYHDINKWYCKHHQDVRKPKFGSGRYAALFDRNQPDGRTGCGRNAASQPMPAAITTGADGPVFTPQSERMAVLRSRSGSGSGSSSGSSSDDSYSSDYSDSDD